MTEPNEPEHILWLDLETTGLQHSSAVLEVAAVITDMDLNEKARNSWIVNPDLVGYQSQSYTQTRATHWVEQMPTVVLEMHVASGLVRKAKESTIPLATAEESLIRLIEKTCGKQAVVSLGGSGVSHFDLQVIRAQMPSLAGKLVYWTIDVGNVRRFATRVMKIKFDRAEIAHRAMADVDQSIAEAKRLCKMFGLPRVAA